MLGQEIARQAAARGFDVMIVDGSKDEAAITAALEARFAPFLEI
jgi:NAD(P)-dependent dehydrogenase (short-subunit alcohol dehydrogenase family)